MTPHTTADLQHSCPFDPLNPSVDASRLLREAREEHPVFFSPELGAWVVTRYKDVQWAAAHPELFSSQGSLAPVMPFDEAVFGILEKGIGFIPSEINTDPPLHARYRVPLNKIFHRDRVALLEPSIRARANVLVDGFEHERDVDLVSAYAQCLPLKVLMGMLGLPMEHQAQLQTWTEDALSLTASRFRLPEERQQQLRCAQSFVDLQTYLQQIVESRLAEPGDDVISLLLNPEFQENPRNPLTSLEAAMVAFGLVIAGHKTTAGLISTAVLHVLQAQQWTTVVEHPESLPLILDEVLRYDGSVPYFFRVTTDAVDIGGVPIAPGELVLLAYGSANHDTSQYVDADHFDSNRFENAHHRHIPHHMAFGYGIHFCVGAFLARLEARIALEVLAQRFSRLCLKEQQEQHYRNTLIFRNVDHLVVELAAHSALRA